MTPGVSMLGKLASNHDENTSKSMRNSRLALKIFHDIQEPIIHIWLVGKLNLDLIKITERILIGVLALDINILIQQNCTHIQDGLLPALS